MAAATQTAAHHEQQIDLLATQLAACQARVRKLTDTRATLRGQLSKAQLHIARLQQAASQAGVDLSTVKLPPATKSRAGRRVLPRPSKLPYVFSRRKRAARRVALRRMQQSERVAEREQRRREREQLRIERASKRGRALTTIRRALPATSEGLVVVNHYVPAPMLLRVKYAAIERDQWLRMLNESIAGDDEWPQDVLPIKGASGVIAQVVQDYFAERDARLAGDDGADELQQQEASL